MPRLLFIVLLLNINYSVSNASQSVDLEGQQTLCTDEKKCEQVDSIFVPNKLEKCSDDLFFQYGADSFAYLTPDGLINSNTNDTECDSSFKRLKYALKNLNKAQEFSLCQEVYNEQRKRHRKPTIRDFPIYARKGA